MFCCCCCAAIAIAIAIGVGVVVVCKDDTKIENMHFRYEFNFAIEHEQFQ